MDIRTIPVHTLELDHPQLTSWTLYVDGRKSNEGQCNGCFSISLPSGKIEIWINPRDKNWGIVPRIRVDGFLVNTYLAGITVYDHMLEFEFGEDFFSRYASKKVASIINSVPEKYRNDEEYISKYFGLSGANESLVKEIRSIIDAKSAIRNDS